MNYSMLISINSLFAKQLNLAIVDCCEVSNRYKNRRNMFVLVVRYRVSLSVCIVTLVDGILMQPNTRNEYLAGS
jgi:hypothetical protein